MKEIKRYNLTIAFFVVLTIFSSLSANCATLNEEQNSSIIEFNNSVFQTCDTSLYNNTLVTYANTPQETFKSPISGREYKIIKNLVNQTTIYKDNQSNSYKNQNEIIDKEMSSSVDPNLFKLDGKLRDIVNNGEITGNVPVIITLLEQPAEKISSKVRAVFGPKLEMIAESKRAALKRMEILNGTDINLNDTLNFTKTMQVEHPDDMRILNETNEELSRNLTQMRKEIFSQTTPLVNMTQEPILKNLTSNGSMITGSSKIYNSIVADVPVSYLKELSQDPSIARIWYDETIDGNLYYSARSIHADHIWANGYTGQTWNAAVIDTGIDGNHPALNGKIYISQIFHTAAATNPDYLDNSAIADDFNGHGTHVAGIVASTDTSNRGIAYGSRIINAKAGWNNRTGSSRMMWSDAMQAIEWACNNDAHVISLSYGGSPGSNGETGFCHFMDFIVTQFNMPVVISAGNSGPGPSTILEPGSAYNVMTVGNIDDKGSTDRADDVIWAGLHASSIGPTGDGRIKPDIVAPGMNSYNLGGIMSCNYNWDHGGPNFIAYYGTSMAAPHITAAVLLALQFTGAWNEKEIKALLLNTAEDKGATGPDNTYGYGYIDINNAYLYRNDLSMGSLQANNPDFYKGIAYDGDTATLVWNRHVDYNTVFPLNDLDLYMYDESDNYPISYSLSALNNVEQVKSNTGYSSVIIKVKPYLFASGITQEAYALATKKVFSKVNPPNMIVSLSIPSSISSGFTFDVQTTVTNSGEIKAQGVDPSLQLPTGFTILQGSNPQFLGIIDGGSSKTATWTVQAPSTSSQSYTISTSAWSSSYGETYTGSDSKTISLGPSTPSDHLGNYKGNGVWALDYNGNGQWDGTSIDRVFVFGSPTDQPVVGDWNNNGKDELGNYKGNGVWALEYNGNGQWDGTSIDRVFVFGSPTDQPVVGDWNNDGKDEPGNYKGNGVWALDYNGNGQWDGTSIDRVYVFGGSTDKPVVGDWNNDGKDELGNYKGNGVWAVDYSGNGQWDGTSIDRVFVFGSPTDQPVVGDWTGDGKDELGNYKGNGVWALDYNGNGQWDGTSIDRVFVFGGLTDKPVVGKW